VPSNQFGPQPRGLFSYLFDGTIPSRLGYARLDTRPMGATLGEALCRVGILRTSGGFNALFLKEDRGSATAGAEKLRRRMRSVRCFSRRRPRMAKCETNSLTLHLCFWLLI